MDSLSVKVLGPQTGTRTQVSSYIERTLGIVESLLFSHSILISRKIYFLIYLIQHLMYKIYDDIFRIHSILIRALCITYK